MITKDFSSDEMKILRDHEPGPWPRERFGRNGHDARLLKLTALANEVRVVDRAVVTGVNVETEEVAV